MNQWTEESFSNVLQHVDGWICYLQLLFPSHVNVANGLLLCFCQQRKCCSRLGTARNLSGFLPSIVKVLLFPWRPYPQEHWCSWSHRKGTAKRRQLVPLVKLHQLSDVAVQLSLVARCLCDLMFKLCAFFLPFARSSQSARSAVWLWSLPTWVANLNNPALGFAVVLPSQWNDLPPENSEQDSGGISPASFLYYKTFLFWWACHF